MATIATAPGGDRLASLRGEARARRRKERAIHAVLVGAAVVSILISAGIVLALLFRALNFLSHVELGSLWSGIWRPRQGQFDLVSLFLGSFVVTGIAMLVATPLGLGRGDVPLRVRAPTRAPDAEAHPRDARGDPERGDRVLRPDRSSIPPSSQGVFGATNTFTMMAAGIGVGLLTIPLIASVAEDAMYAVPGALREAAYGIGARRRDGQHPRRLPGRDLGDRGGPDPGISRALGETMVVAIAAGATGNASRTLDPLEPNQTLTAAIASLAIGSDQVKTARVRPERVRGALPRWA